MGANASRNELVGSTLDSGRYHVTSLLGEGNMGQVFRAEDRRLGADVVIKIPSVQALADEEFVERFQREIRSLVQLSHPHIVKIIDVGTHDDLPYVVLQYLSGGSLKDRLLDDTGRQLAQPVSSLRSWLLEVAKALDFMHQQGVVHRDVKPANILFDQHKNAFLSDFGLAKVLANKRDARAEAALTAAGFLVGTPNYVAPELVMGHAYDGRADQYSLAVTVMEVLLGYVPFEGASASATMVNQTSMKPPALRDIDPNISKQVSDAVLRGLSKNPARRFENCVAFANAILGGSPTHPAAGRPPGQKVTAARGMAGRVACPRCGKFLPIPPALAGKKARCAKCKSLLQISPDRTALRLIPSGAGGRSTPAPQRAPSEMPPLVARRGAGSTARNARGGTGTRPGGASEGDVAVIGEEVFGLKISKAMAGVLVVVMVVLLTGVAVFLGRQSTQSQMDELRIQTIKPGGLEK